METRLHALTQRLQVLTDRTRAWGAEAVAQPFGSSFVPGSRVRGVAAARSETLAATPRFMAAFDVSEPAAG